MRSKTKFNKKRFNSRKIINKNVRKGSRKRIHGGSNKSLRKLKRRKVNSRKQRGGRCGHSWQGLGRVDQRKQVGGCHPDCDKIKDVLTQIKGPKWIKSGDYKKFRQNLDKLMTPWIKELYDVLNENQNQNQTIANKIIDFVNTAVTRDKIKWLCGANKPGAYGILYRKKGEEKDINCFKGSINIIRNLSIHSAKKVINDIEGLLPDRRFESWEGDIGVRGAPDFKYVGYLYPKGCWREGVKRVGNKLAFKYNNYCRGKYHNIEYQAPLVTPEEGPAYASPDVGAASAALAARQSHGDGEPTYQEFASAKAMYAPTVDYVALNPNAEAPVETIYAAPTNPGEDATVPATVPARVGSGIVWQNKNQPHTFEEVESEDDMDKKINAFIPGLLQQFYHGKFKVNRNQQDTFIKTLDTFMKEIPHPGSYFFIRYNNTLMIIWKGKGKKHLRMTFSIPTGTGTEFKWTNNKQERTYTNATEWLDDLKLKYPVDIMGDPCCGIQQYIIPFEFP